MIFFTAIGLLILAFICHLILWRIRRPARFTLAFFIIFLIFYFGIFFITFLPGDIFRFTLLYWSSALVYIILYSAIDQQSPTLAIVDFIKTHGDFGCDESAIIQYLAPEDEIKKRLMAMTQSGWVSQEGQYWVLTQQGKMFAALFGGAAKFFGLNRGG